MEIFSLKREAALLVLKKHGIKSAKLKKMIFRRVFPSLDMVQTYLEENDVNLRQSPQFWDDGNAWGFILAQEGGLADDEFGLDGYSRKWIKNVAGLLGLKYKDLGESYKAGWRYWEVSVPKKYCFPFPPPKPKRAYKKRATKKRKISAEV